MNCVTRFLHLWAWNDSISCCVPLNIPFRFVELDFDSVEIFIVNYKDINIIWSTPTKHWNLINKKMMWLIHNKREWILEFKSDVIISKKKKCKSHTKISTISWNSINIYHQNPAPLPKLILVWLGARGWRDYLQRIWSRDIPPRDISFTVRTSFH